MYLLTVLVTAGRGCSSGPAAPPARVSVTDVNDNAPRLSQDRAFLAVRENLPPGTGFGRVSASDRDAGLNGRLAYRLLHADRTFQINSQTGEISTRVALNREHQSGYQLVVVVQDGGTPPAAPRAPPTSPCWTRTTTPPPSPAESCSCSAVLKVLTPDCPPTPTLQVLEGQPAGSLLGTVQAKDPDEGENGTVFYSLSGPRAELFSLDPVTGELRSSSPLLLSERAEYSFTVSATDHGLPPQSSSTSLRIQVLSSSRTTPKPNSKSMTISSVEGAKPGSVIGSVASHDKQRAPEAGQVTYVVVGGTDRDGTFMVDRLTGDVYLTRELDYEEGAHYTLQVEVDDFSKAYPSSHLVQLDIEVQDSNDHAPQFPEDPVTIVVPENMEPGSSVYTFQAEDRDGTGPNSEATDSAPDPAQRRRGSVTARVFVTDENDNAPVFGPPAAVSVMEDQPAGFVVLYVMARDADRGENGRVSYRIRDGNAGGKFSLNPDTGSLSILKPIDREEQELYNLTVVAEDHGTPQRSATQLLSVQVIDVNDEAPRFERAEFEAEILENQPPGTPVLTVSASDLDQGTNGAVTYGGVAETGFAIDPVTGVISATRALDREVQDRYTITVYAKDGGLPAKFAKASVRIAVRDENDNAPAFGRPYYALEVPENLEPVQLFTLRATDLDAGSSGEVEYRITAGDPAGDFRLDRSSGVLWTARALDRERKARYALTVVAQDRGSPPLSSSATVDVAVLDVNDNGPRFDSAGYAAEVREDAAAGSLVLQASAADEDAGPNGEVLYFLSGEAGGASPSTRRRAASPPPRWTAKRASYSFCVCATDPRRRAPQRQRPVTVHVLDVNDNAPFFVQDPLVINVSSGGGGGTGRQVVATMRAEDKDFGANGSVFYRFASPAKGFAINSLTGDIQVSERHLALSQSQRTLIVEAMDQGSPAQSSLGVVLVYVKEQEYRGIRFSRNARDVSLQENAAKGTAVVQTQAQYPDGTRSGINYSIFSGNRLQSFRISPTTGEIWVQSSTGLDFEENPRLRLVVKAETASSSSYMAVNLILQDVNDNLPRFQLQNYVAYIRESQGYDFPIIQVLADDLDQGQNGQVTYSIKSSSMSGLFRIDPLTGSISTAAIMDREIWTQTKLVVTATDRGSPRLAGSATLTVIIVDLNDNSPTIPLPRDPHTLIGTEITQVTGNDVDSGPALSYTLQLDGHARGKFGIHRYGGGVSLTAPLDFEERTWYTLTVRASDSKHQSEANLTVLVEDVNDNAPVFTQDLYQVTLLEHSPPGSPVITVTATDRDSGENGKVTYRVMSSTRDGFHVDPSNGTLFFNRRVEFDPKRPAITVVIEAGTAAPRPCPPSLPSRSRCPTSTTTPPSSPSRNTGPPCPRTASRGPPY
ncbi:hypothetical protein ANANG_G00239900 [Anguilla anguilla]|uniref:Cadherin domain-containing protein n=1 Tax=Anguilla anguilla TaxID=7936 RepID=A0A9D3LV12_ANGAN|nr:hypothetical protein ANANG_G00239900 [Anguilla anguilla]